MAFTCIVLGVAVKEKSLIAALTQQGRRFNITYAQIVSMSLYSTLYPRAKNYVEISAASQ